MVPLREESPLTHRTAAAARQAEVDQIDQGDASQVEECQEPRECQPGGGRKGKGEKVEAAEFWFPCSFGCILRPEARNSSPAKKQTRKAQQSANTIVEVTWFVNAFVAAHRTPKKLDN